MNPVVVKLLISLLIKILEMIKARYDSMTPEQKRALAAAIKAMPVHEDEKRDPITAGYAEP